MFEGIRDPAGTEGIDQVTDRRLDGLLRREPDLSRHPVGADVIGAGIFLRVRT